MNFCPNISTGTIRPVSKCILKLKWQIALHNFMVANNDRHVTHKPGSMGVLSRSRASECHVLEGWHRGPELFAVNPAHRGRHGTSGAAYSVADGDDLLKRVRPGFQSFAPEGPVDRCNAGDIVIQHL